MYVCMHVCMFIYIYIYTHTYVKQQDALRGGGLRHGARLRRPPGQGAHEGPTT